MTKKKLLVATLIGTFLFFVLVYSQALGICPSYNSCADFLDDVALILFPILPLFLFSLITYFLKDTVYQAWWRFARIVTPISMLLVLAAPSYSHDWMFPIEKGSVAFFTSIIFVFMSLIIVIRNWKR